MENTKVKISSKNLSTLAAEYGVSKPTMRKWLKKVPNLNVENRDTKDYTPKEIRLIYEHLGVSGEPFD